MCPKQEQRPEERCLFVITVTFGEPQLFGPVCGNVPEATCGFGLGGFECDADIVQLCLIQLSKRLTLTGDRDHGDQGARQTCEAGKSA